jgi:bacteriocin-like protein
MANPRNPHDDGKAPEQAPPHGAETDQDKIEITKEELEKVSGGGSKTPRSTQTVPL